MKQTRSKIIFLMILCIWGLITSCVSPSKAVEKYDSRPHSFLWEATKGKQILTLVGTMHVGITPEDMNPVLWSRINQADTVLIETDIGNSDSRLMERFLTMPAGVNLSDMFGKPYWEKFTKVLKDSGSPVPEAQLHTITPLAAGIFLLQSQAKAEDDMKEGQLSIDQIIFDKAKALHKKTRTFETNEEQLIYLKNIFTIDALKKMLDEWTDESESYDTMKKAFNSGDTEALDALLEDVPKEIRTSLLDERNHHWMLALPKLSSPNHTLIAVGAAHFAGPEGLLKLLEHEGYVIHPIKRQPPQLVP